MRTDRCKTPSQKQMNNHDEKDCIEVFCRLRRTDNVEEPTCLRIVDSQTIALMTSKINTLYGNEGVKKTLYSFSEVFKEKVSQEEIFERTALPLVKDLIFGNSGVLFTYGITSSGKTQTMMGTPEDCGILPRCLDVIFNSIEGLQAKKHVFKSDKLNDFDIQTEEEAELDQRRERCRNQSTLTTRKKDRILEWSHRKSTNTKVDLSTSGMRYSVFVSYVEIYNNFIYDLLEESSTIVKPKPFASKMIREDSSRKTYIFGVNEVEVKEADEAFEMLQRGQLHRRVSDTILSKTSSRSHLVFTIRVVQARLQALESTTPDTKLQICVSQLSLVDLAGSERFARTGNTRDRPREIGNVSSSLMALRSCIETMREAQRMSKVVPYRQSKLTYLFKAFFEGEGKIKLIICVNPSVSDHDEMTHVLKFAELSQEVLVARPTPLPTYFTAPVDKERRKSGPKYVDEECLSSHSIILERSKRATTPRRKQSKTKDLDEDLDPIIPSMSIGISKLLGEDESFEETLSDLIQTKECLKRRRQTMKDNLAEKQSQFRGNLISLDKELNALRQENVFLRIDLNGREEQVKNLEKDLCKADQTVILQKKKIETLENTIRKLQFEIKEKNAEVESCLVDKVNLKEDMERKMAAEKERVRKNTAIKFLQKQFEFEKKAKVTKRKVELMKEILNADELQGDDDMDAGDADFLSRSLGHTCAAERRYKKRNQVNDKAITEKIMSRKNSGSSAEDKSRSCKSWVDCKRPHSSVEKRRADDAVESKTRTLQPPCASRKGSKLSSKPATNSMCNLGDFGSLTRNIAVANPRHRRSHSSDKDLWVEHKPLSNLELDTVLQPVMKRKISVNKLLASDITKDASKYVLEHQEHNSEGEFETRLYKADVIPSQCGGAQVVFKDVEKLRQVSPPDRYCTKKSNHVRQLPREEIKENCSLSCQNHGLSHRL